MSAGRTSLPRSRRDFSRRSEESEWPDRADLDPADLARFLRDLARFNGALLGRLPILLWLNRAIAAIPQGRPIRLIDAGCGYGDLLRAIRGWARRRGIAIALCGVDANPETIRIARAVTQEHERIDFTSADIFRFCPAAPVDLIVSSLLAHHLADPAIVNLLRWMEATAERGWLVCDLQRHPLPYHLVGLAGKFLPVDPVVVRDGQVSVARALVRSEWHARLGEAGIPPHGATIRWFLFRSLIGRLR